MVQAKWLKFGAAAVLSIGMLAGCGDAEDEAPTDADVTPEEGEEEVVPEGDITDTDSEFHDDDSDDHEEEESGG